MPRPKRWFHVNQDINDDPEFRELERRFGSKGICIFLEFMSMLDRTENQIVIKPNIQVMGHMIARKVGSQFTFFVSTLKWMIEKKWVQVGTIGNQSLANDSKKIEEFSQPNQLKNNETLKHETNIEEKDQKHQKISKRFGKDLEIFLKSFAKDSEKILYFYAPNFLKYRGNRGHENETSCSPPSLSLPKEKKKSAVPALSRPSLRSVEEEERAAVPGCEVPKNSGQTKGHNSADLPDYALPAFEAVWDLWPRKEGYGAAKRAWNKLRLPKETVDQILVDIPNWKNYTWKQYTSINFIKKLENWLLEEGYRDRPPRRIIC